jgi:hypothetical protein
MKHTPAPWKIEPARLFGDENKFGVAISNGKDRDQFAFVYTKLSDDGIEIEDSEELESNAQLIAAAPELLEALTELLHDYTTTDFDFVGLNPSLIEKCKSIISKAESL